jgi:hypothetical protein
MTLIRRCLVALAMSGLLLLAPNAFADEPEEVEEEQPIERYEVLGMITGIHTVDHKASKLRARLLEADGSASVAWNPVTLFLVVTNSGGADEVTRIWRLPRGVERVRGFTPTTCGVDVRAEVVRVVDTLAVGTKLTTLRLCFVSSNGSLSSKLGVSTLRQGRK